MNLIQRWHSLLGKKAATEVNSVLEAGGGTSALLTKDTPGTRDFALVEAERLGFLARSTRMGRIDFYRYGPVFDFTLTPAGEAARRCVNLDVASDR
ncbi:hypothetical protein [Brevundimonas sp.]|jgi:hypothetical protein|uniref:hypothetical protein n=1 Tax=Brevundimonas sp. TaxID=1871086 RepID=UPI0028AE8653|nr:hypothetical protein [Brevundimonas sp.]